MGCAPIFYNLLKFEPICFEKLEIYMIIRNYASGLSLGWTTAVNCRQTTVHLIDLQTLFSFGTGEKPKIQKKRKSDGPRKINLLVFSLEICVKNTDFVEFWLL